LIRERSAYRVFDDDIIAPIASAAEGVAVEKAFVDLAEKEYAGARAHLRAAASSATEGEWAASIRESVNAVESVARILAPGSREIGPALVRLEERKVIHPALKKGFGAIYGFTSDERGLRHPLIDEPVADVDETDSLFMLGACASFVSYMIAKGRLQP
jgi:hypothetical protein